MILGKIISITFCCLNFFFWTAAKYLLVNVKDENQEDFTGIPDNESYQWADLENNETLSLSGRRLGTDDIHCAKMDLACPFKRLHCR